MRLLLITEDSRAIGPVLAALPRGAAAVQLRAPQLPAGALLARAREVRAICARFGARMLVNDRLDVALAAGADGVHLPGRGVAPNEVRELFARAGRDAIVGVSCHSTEDVARASSGGADYAVFSPIWDVPNKGPAVGLEALRAASSVAPLPVYALGGVTGQNAAQAIAAGARGVACIRFVFDAHDPPAAAVALWQAVTA
jgi:thiamine-phosphate pyrophosphorylase